MDKSKDDPLSPSVWQDPKKRYNHFGRKGTAKEQIIPLPLIISSMLKRCQVNKALQQGWTASIKIAF
jgi:hypothetical protein